MNETLKFLQDWLPDGPWSLGAIDPNDAKGIAWLTTTKLDEAEFFIDDQAALDRNLYFQINLQRPDLGTNRASKTDAAVGIAIHAEIDPPADGTPESLSAWQVTQGTHYLSKEYWVTKGLPYPSLITFTGSGFLIAWKLSYPVLLWQGEPLEQCPLRIEGIESRNRFLVTHLGADSASTDVSRLLRLPYSINIPNESKRAKGRTDSVPSEVLHFDPSSVHGLGLFKTQERVETTYTEHKVDFAGAPSRENWTLAVQALAETWPRGQRHSAHLALSGALARASWPTELIVDFLVDVAEAEEPGNGDRTKRENTVRDTLSNASANRHTWGWPALVGFVGKEALDKCTQALGVSRSVPPADPHFVEKLRYPELQKQEQAANAPIELNETPPVLDDEHDEGPSFTDILAELKATQRKLSPKKNKEAIKAASILKRVLNGDPLVDDIGEDGERAFREAVIAVVTHAPQGSSTTRLCKVLMSSSGKYVGSLPETVVKVRTFLESKAEQADEFEIEVQGTKTGFPKPGSLHNFAVALRKLGVKLRYNEFSNRKLITYEDQPETNLSDKHTINIRMKIEKDFKFEPPKDKFLDYVNDCAWSDSFHPVRDYLDSLPAWDGVPRIEEWLIKTACAEDTEYVRAVSRLVLSAAVRRVRQPGCKFDEMMILEGKQGTSKSGGLKVLCPNREWFTDDFPLNGDSKIVIERTRGKWIIEAGELKGMGTGETSILKSQLSRTDDESRMAYGRETDSVKRSFIIIGTTNDSKYLKDPSGDRRYWPIKISLFDTHLLASIRDQLWAEANYLDQQHPEEEYIRLDPSLYAAAAEQQNQRRIEDPAEDRLVGIIGDNNGMILGDDVYRCLGFERMPSKADVGRVSNAMQALGFVSERKKIGNSTLRVWVRGNIVERNTRLTLTGNPITGWEIVAPKETGTDVQPN